MTRYIRRAALLCALLLVALLVNVVRVQLVRSETYSGNPANRRTDIARWGQPRGDILVGGRPVTGSRDTGGLFRYARTYTDGPLYAPVTGFASQVYGSTLLEHARDGLLAGTDPGLAALPLLSGLTRARGTGGTVVTTIDPEAQRAAHEGLAGRHGAVAALDPVTGRILALVSAPSYDPGELSGTGAASARAWRRLDGDPDRPMLNRAVGQTYPPGSTFKVVTAAAALDAGVAGDLDAPTDSPDPYTLPGTRTRLTNEVEGCTDASLRYAFTWSCNTVFARLGVETGWKAMSRTAAAFGFDAPGRGCPSRWRGRRSRHRGRPRRSGTARSSRCPRSGSSTPGRPRCRWRWSPRRWRATARSRCRTWWSGPRRRPAPPCPRPGRAPCTGRCAGRRPSGCGS